MKSLGDITRLSSRHRFLLPQTSNSISSAGPLGRQAVSFPKGRLINLLEWLYLSRSKNGKYRPLGPDSSPPQLAALLRCRGQCLGGFLLLLRTNVESIERKMQVDRAD
jgi:hypothetical protein